MSPLLPVRPDASPPTASGGVWVLGLAASCAGVAAGVMRLLA